MSLAPNANQEAYKGRNYYIVGASQKLDKQPAVASWSRTSLAWGGQHQNCPVRGRSSKPVFARGNEREE